MPCLQDKSDPTVTSSSKDSCFYRAQWLGNTWISLWGVSQGEAVKKEGRNAFILLTQPGATLLPQGHDQTGQGIENDSGSYLSLSRAR